MGEKRNQSTGKNVVVGVFITKKHAQGLMTMSQKLVNTHRYIRYIELAEANRGMDVTLYFFATGDADFEKKCVRGIFYNYSDDTWQQKIFPLPHLLYDRGGGTSRQSTGVIKKFRELGIRNINARHYFDKWDLFDRLSGIETVSPHLPATVKGDKFDNIFHMLDRYGHVYVKTRRGSCGTGVIRIERNGPDRLRYYYSYGGRLFSGIIAKQELEKILNRFFAHKPFIVQEPVDLIKKDQCIIDFRSEVQKNKDGQIMITGTTARIGRLYSPIASNTHKEDYYPVEKFLMQFGAPRSDVLQAKINGFLLTVFRAVEQVYGSFGEMGIDFGMDTKGHLWLIECNSKSAKVALYNAYGRQKVRESFRNLLQYAIFLVQSQNSNNTREKVQQ